MCKDYFNNIFLEKFVPKFFRPIRTRLIEEIHPEYPLGGTYKNFPYKVSARISQMSLPRNCFKSSFKRILNNFY